MPEERPAVVFGEVLFDCFEDRQVLGGAPFNVAWSLRGFGVRPLFVSRVGDDPLGDRVMAAMGGWEMDRQWVQRDPDHPTGTVRVELAGAEPSFEIAADQAYDHIDAAEMLPRLVPLSPALLYHGTLAARHPHSAGTLRELRAAIGSPVFVDVNLRAPWWEPEAVMELVHGARWVKLNEVELAELSDEPGDPQAMARSFRRRLDIDILVVTRGDKGAFALAGNDSVEAPGAQVQRLVDTVGAGDAFSAVVIMGILNDWPLTTSLARAAAFAAAVCGQRGATQKDGSFYRRARQEWTDD